MNSLEDRVHDLANHLDDELRSASARSNLDFVSVSSDNGEGTIGFRSTAKHSRIPRRTVTVVSAVLAVVTCVGAAAVLLRRVDDPAESTSAPVTVPAPSVWDGGVALVVYMRNDAATGEIDAVRAALVGAADLVDVAKLQYLDIQAMLAEAQRLLANDPESLAFLTADNVPTMFKVVPTPDATAEQLAQFSQTLLSMPGVLRADTPSKSPVTNESPAPTFQLDAVVVATGNP